MRRKRSTPDDPVVAEVRRWRAKLQRDTGGTLEGLVRYLQEKDREFVARGGKLITAPLTPASPAKPKPAKKRRKAA